MLRFRYHLFGFLVLSCGCAPLQHIAFKEAAAWRSLRNDKPLQALAILNSVRKPRCTTLFLRVNAELSAGNYQEATREATRLIALDPRTPEVAVLGKLVERRKHHEDESWLQSFGAAWRAAGAPDMTNFAVADVSPKTLPIPHAPLPIRPSIQQLAIQPASMLAVPDMISSQTDLMTISTAQLSGNGSLPMKLVALTWLDMTFSSDLDLPSQLESAAREAWKSSLHELLIEYPQYLILRLYALIRSDTPTREHLLKRYARASMRVVELMPPRLGLFMEYRTICKTIFSDLADLCALNALSRVDSAVIASNIITIGRRFAGRNGSDSAVRLMSLLARLYMDRSTFLHWYYASLLMKEAASLSGNNTMKLEANVLKVYSLLLFRGAGNVLSAAQSWPLGSVSNEAVRAIVTDEIGAYHQLLGLDQPANLKRILATGLYDDQ